MSSLNFVPESGKPYVKATAMSFREPPYDEATSYIDPNETSSLELHSQLRVLWEEFQSLKLKLGDVEQKTESGGMGAESTKESDTHDQNTGPRHFNSIPEVRRVNYVQYKNRVSLDECRFAIEALWSGPLLEKESQQEMQDRPDFLTHKIPLKGRKQQSKHLLPRRINIVDKAEHRSDADSQWMQRVRLNSPALLATLARLCGERWSSLPRSFSRPFKLLIHLQEKVRAVLKNLEDRVGSDGASTPADSASQISIGEEHPEGDVLHFVPENVPEALLDLRCYLKFVDTEIIPLHRKWEKADSTSGPGLRKIRFEDVWYLFRTGDIVYLPNTADLEHRQKTSIRQSTWRVYALHSPMDRYKIRPVDHRKFINEEADGGEFRIRCYYIDWTGESFCAVTEEFKIPRFDGERAIKDLNIFPIRFMDNHEKAIEEFRSQGQEFLDCIKQRHRTYNWWTNPCTPNGGPVTDQDGNEVRHSQHVHSDVIVDFIEAFQVCSSWKPMMSNLQPIECDSLTTADEILIREYSDPERTRLLSETPEILQLKSGVEEWDRNKHVHEDEFLKSVRELAAGHGNNTDYEFSDEDLCILPTRVFAYVLRERRFAQLDARHLKKVTATPNGFENLKISRKHKSLIQGLVNSHFLSKGVEREHGVENIGQDLIIGKGRGLVVLLHGVPGVGKTATAEAVAQTSGKPLFPITCGDLGTKPKEVEEALHEIFRLASLWDAILLLDEVDTFFSQRSRQDSDIVRNALVSVFLRALEYYNGILFLTTNRTGTLDEAFKSRVQVKIYYPPLEENQTMEIWEMNINRLRVIDLQRSNSTGEPPLQIYEKEIMRFAREHYQKHAANEGHGRWNGRQIRNAFQIASALAYYDHRNNHQRLLLEDPDARSSMPVLGIEHFVTMAELTSAFDDYLLETLGVTHGDQAYDNAERFDAWNYKSQQPNRTPGVNVPRSSQAYQQEGRGSLDEDIVPNSPPHLRMQSYENIRNRREQPQSQYGRGSAPSPILPQRGPEDRSGLGGRQFASDRDYPGHYGSHYTTHGYTLPASGPNVGGRAPGYGGQVNYAREREPGFAGGLEQSSSQHYDYNQRNLHSSDERREHGDYAEQL